MNTPAPDDPLSPGTHNWWPPQRRRTWFALLGGPFAWGLHIMLGWLVSGNACLLHTPNWGPLSKTTSWVLEGLVGVVCIGMAAAALWVAILDWRGSANHRINHIHDPDRPDFVVAAAVLVSASFVLANIYNGLAQIMLPLCEAVR